MGVSLDSSRPIMAPSIMSMGTSIRSSTCSSSPSFVNSIKANLLSISAQQAIHEIKEGLQKMENRKLTRQRFVPSKEKSEHLSKLALGAKLERALGRRMGGQDAVMREQKVRPNEQIQREKTAFA